MGKVYIEAYACSEFGDGPQYAMVEATQEFCDTLRGMASVCTKNNLTELRVMGCPDFWGPKGVEDGLRLTMPELVITADSFWFTDHPKHADYSIETRAVGIDEFCAAVSEGGPTFFGDEPAELEALVDEDAE